MTNDVSKPRRKQKTASAGTAIPLTNSRTVFNYECKTWISDIDDPRPWGKPLHLQFARLRPDYSSMGFFPGFPSARKHEDVANAHFSAKALGDL